MASEGIHETDVTEDDRRIASSFNNDCDDS